MTGREYLWGFGWLTPAEAQAAKVRMIAAREAHEREYYGNYGMADKIREEIANGDC